MYRAFPQIDLPWGIRTLWMVLALSIAPELSFAAEANTTPDLTQHWVGYSALLIFVIAYVIVILEERLHLRKSKPVIVAAGIIWALIAAAEVQNGTPGTVEKALRHNLLEFAELFLFLLAAMTYINTMAERGVFAVLRSWLVSQGFSLRTIFWLTGLLAFFISPIADNLTTALLMATVVMTVGGSNRHFVVIACINIVVAANAGGAFSPFGDITTLMVWQKGIVEFQEFFVLFVPSVVNWLVPAVFMAFAIPKERPPALDEHVELKRGALVVVGLFLVTISMAVSFHNFLHLPPVLGMMTGLGLLKFFGYYLKRRDQAMSNSMDRHNGRKLEIEGYPQPAKPFNIFEQLERAEWDTLMFFYGIILCVGGLGAIGYLALGSQFMYVDLGPTTANILVGILSAIVDNIPVMFAVLSMQPEMGHGQWLLVTLTAGVGGSLLSIGSAAGVAVMGQARGIYTFFAHLKWLWAIALGYAASIWVHLTLNARLFQ
ncbi:Citrate transporter [Nitrosococcus halophilus Nc 4]|uniref:Citrate transporter n=1 Tax=Nitrosococcus halophilus (strain Nc4) TaxID=472759 RepID=D5BWN6_NITHN|nr:sodium:proton antiporter NhaD [Nitrosococcus halophilus]ADE15693.1 Citrate transporter [Nitrosococcus halophilus Nc 4]